MITGEIKSQIDKVWEAFWTGGISNPLTVIEQFTFLLFLRRLDERQTLAEKKANLSGKPLENPFYTKEQQALRWSQFKDRDPEDMFALFTKPQLEIDNLTVFEHMKQMGSNNDGGAHDGAGVFASFMKGATFMIPTPRLLDQVVQMIGAIKMDDRDTKGDLYEYLLSKIATAGTNGQFRTPRHIIEMMVQMVKPTQEDTICDPSCGSAGFLVGAGEYIHDHHPEWFHEPTFNAHYNSEMFTGIEFDSTMLRIGAMNLQLHGIDRPQLVGRDALSEANAEYRDKFSLILANPPFKGSLDYDAVESSLLNTSKTKKTELLFLSLILRMLKIGGRCAVIVPDGVLFGSSKAHVQLRKTLVEEQKLDAVISMPSGVFKPYAGVSTAILLFTKTNHGGTDDVFFYDMQADGFSLDDKRTPTEQSDLADIVEKYKQWQNLTTPSIDGGSPENTEAVFTDKKQQAFKVSKGEIADNKYDLSINRYKEIEYEEVVYEAPSVILDQLEALEAEIQADLKELRGML